MTIAMWARRALIMGSTAALIAVPSLVGAVSHDNALNTDDLGLDYGAATGLGTRSLQETIASIIRVALSLLGIVAVVIILAGGFKWMTAGGDPGNVEKAKGLIFNGIIGLAIILTAFAISKFVIESLVTATQS